MPPKRAPPRGCATTPATKKPCAPARRLTILVLFDGIGGARLGLLRAGHRCVGVEIDQACTAMSVAMLTAAGHASTIATLDEVGAWLASPEPRGSPTVHLDVRALPRSFINRFDAVWASPPCQQRSLANVLGTVADPIRSVDMVGWCLGTAPGSPLAGYENTLWVENVHNKRSPADWGVLCNLAQHQAVPVQSRNRVIGGHHTAPAPLRPHKEYYRGVAGVRWEEQQDGGLLEVSVPARNSATRGPTPPGHAAACSRLPASLAEAVLEHLDPPRGICPPLLASEWHAPGSIRSPTPRTNSATASAATTASTRSAAAELVGPTHQHHLDIVAAILYREHHYRHNSSLASRYWRRQVTLREALMHQTFSRTVGECTAIASALEGIRATGTPAIKHNNALLAAIGNAVPPHLAQVYGTASEN